MKMRSILCGKLILLFWCGVLVCSVALNRFLCHLGSSRRDRGVHLLLSWCASISSATMWLLSPSCSSVRWFIRVHFAVIEASTYCCVCAASSRRVRGVYLLLCVCVCCIITPGSRRISLLCVLYSHAGFEAYRNFWNIAASLNGLRCGMLNLKIVDRTTTATVTDECDACDGVCCW